MKKYIIYIILLTSILVNIHYVNDYIKNKNFEIGINVFIERLRVKNVPLKTGLEFLNKKTHRFNLNKNIKEKKFLSIWNVFCRPCIIEMPVLDSIAAIYGNKNINFYFVTENGEKTINEFIKKKKIDNRCFKYINDADTFITAFLSHYKINNRVYPIQIVLDENDNIEYYKIGTVEFPDDSALISIFNKTKNVSH